MTKDTRTARKILAVWNNAIELGFNADYMINEWLEDFVINHGCEYRGEDLDYTILQLPMKFKKELLTEIRKVYEDIREHIP